jgi:hypothetical protein
MNAGAITFLEGVLFVGENFGRGRVLVFDGEGRGLHAGFELGSRSAVSGLIADSDRRLWIADTESKLVRAWNVFGREDQGFAPATYALDAPAGGIEDGPVDVALSAGSTWTGLWVAMGGQRRGAVGLYLADGTRLESLRSQGLPQNVFDRVTRLATAGELVGALEAGAHRVQIFRRLDFHMAMPLGRLGFLGAGRAVALELLEDGSAVVGFAAEDAGGVDRILWLDPTGQVRGEVANSSAPTHPGGATISGLVDLALEAPHAEAALFVLDQLGARVQVLNLRGRAWGAFETDTPYSAD